MTAISKADVQDIADAIFGLADGLVGDIKKLTNFSPEYRLTGSETTGFFIERRHTANQMEAQVIEKQGKKEYAVIPYKDFLRMQQELDDYHDLLALRKAKSDPRNQQGRSFQEAASELGLKNKRIVSSKGRP